MSRYISTSSLEDIAAVLLAAKRVIVTTHSKPDGDAFGAVVALSHALELKAKQVERWIMPPLPPSLEALNSLAAPLHVKGSQADPLPAGEPDVIVIVDTGSWSQLAPMRDWLASRRDRIVVVDHHLYGDDVGQWRYVDTSAAAVCQIVAGLIDAMRCPWDSVIATALYVGIASDTGWFRFSNTTARVHELAARLLGLGVDHAGLYEKLEHSERPQKLQLAARALNSLEFLAGGRAVLMTLTAADFQETGARPEETERLVDLPQVVGQVQLVALLTEVDAANVRISFRSKPGDDAIDVNALAHQFGGGGHARASGAKIAQPIAIVRPRLVQAMTRAAAGDASRSSNGGAT
jgi:bifunctional oligoribonuclease and PAP phosphatase NrnA